VGRSLRWRVEEYGMVKPPTLDPGLLSMTVPCTLSEGLPIGMMLVGKKCDETTILKAARVFEGTEAYAVRPEGAKSASS
jgi:Asp-tRNA(Asn)/Glu-tRNA(Gln) amidotransferase A subunit family amidase